MLADQDGRDGHGVDAPAAEGLHDDLAGIALVVPGNLRFRQVPGAGNGAVEVVRMGSTVAGQVPFRLGQGRSEAGVGVDHAAHLREAAVDLKMRGKIRGGPQIPLHDVAQKVRHHHLLRRHGGVLHPGGLDDDMLSVRRPGGDIAPGQYHKTVLRQALVLPADLLLQLLPHTVLPSPA